MPHLSSRLTWLRTLIACACAGLIAIVCVLQSASACLWEYSFDLNGGQLRFLSDLSLSRAHPFSYSLNAARTKPSFEWEKKLEELANQRDSDYRLQSDYAVALTHLGRYKEALGIFEKLEAAHPGTYVNAANLGTAYELAGDLPEALRWIKESITRNPQAHAGTEWLHTRILEARIALSKDPAYLESHTVLGLDFGTKARPTLPSSMQGHPKELHRVIKALHYQLYERIQFVRAADPIVAGLLFDLSNAIALGTVVSPPGGIDNSHESPIFTLEDALETLHLANDYGAVPTSLVRRRIIEYYILLYSQSALFTAGLLLVLGIGIFIRNRRKSLVRRAD